MKYKLKELAAVERVSKDKEYQAGTILVQVSATNGQTIWHDGGLAETKYVAINADETKIKPRFLYHYIKTTIENYLPIIKTGLNIQVEEIENYPIEFPINEKMRR